MGTKTTKITKEQLLGASEVYLQLISRKGSCKSNKTKQKMSSSMVKLDGGYGK